MKAVFSPGSTFASYRVESLLGRGGMGVVYRATDLSLERPVALKLIAPELAQDAGFRARFLREPKLAASLDHPNVIPIYEAGEHDGQLYLAMRFVEGSDLKSVLVDEGRLAPERALAILAQVAGALDAAHKRALVHRDVKPANVLLDGEGHVYLTDFGITKQVGGDSTDTGQLVGTLDYLAPEQIRGDPVDGRTDCYALACVLYECVSGAPPFRRASEGETLWAHMQEQPAPLRRHSALDPVMRKALAKDREDRYRSCGELIDAAAGALGLSAPRPVVTRLEPSVLRRRGRLLLGGGLALLVAVAAVLTLALGEDEGGIDAASNGIASIDASGEGIASFTKTGAAPGSVAVGEGAVWVLSSDERTVARLDTETKAVTRRLRLRGAPPTDIAAGGGAVWVGTGSTGRLARIDPRSGRTTRSIRLPDKVHAGDFGGLFWGFPQIAVGSGAVWAINPDRTVSRIDPASGRRVATVNVDATTIAAGAEGVWFIDGDDTRRVGRIDPRTNRLAQRIELGTYRLSGLAVGGGSVWASAEGEGVVWRIEPGPNPVQRTIDIGVGVTYVTYGAGAAWAANYVDGKVSRVDPRTNEVTATSVDAVQGLAAGAGSLWAPTAGAATAGAFPEPGCRELASRVPDPDVLIAADLPLQGDDAFLARPIAAALEFVVGRSGFRAGRHTVGFRLCDDATAQTGSYDPRRCAANAQAYSRVERLVAVVGAFNSDCSQVEIPILNRAPGGPIAMISPGNTYQGLTRRGMPAPHGYRGEPDVLYPTGERNYTRVLPLDDMGGPAHALLARQLGLDSVYVLYDPSTIWKGMLADPFRYAARRVGVEVVGFDAIDPAAEDAEAIAERVARAGADGVVLAIDPPAGGDTLVRALRARLGRRLALMGGFYFQFVPEVLEFIGPSVRGMYVPISDLPRSVLERTPAAERFLAEFGDADTDAYVLEAAQAAELVLRAIARSDGTRASVLEELKASRVEDGILGSFRFDRNGDITPATVPILRITGSTPPSARLLAVHQGAVVDRVVEIPRRLLR